MDTIHPYVNEYKYMLIVNTYTVLYVINVSIIVYW